MTSDLLRQFCTPAQAAYRTNAVPDLNAQISSHSQACVLIKGPGGALLVQTLVRTGYAGH
jgi:hypothetical protein